MKKIYILSDAKDLPTHKNCEDAIKEAGGGAVLCNLHASDEQFTDADGFLIPGGWDINPALYHEENTASLNINDELDYFQMQAVCYAVSHKIPILGICRGMQLLNVYFGGSLIQNIPNTDRHARDKGSQTDKVHPVTALPGTYAAALYGKERFFVNSSHHQAVGRLGSGLRAVMYSDDHLIEGICHESLPVIGVQWHPERMTGALRRVDTEDGRPVFEKFLSMI